jgi:fumarate hydratase class II
MHIAAVLSIEDRLMPAIDEMIAVFRRLERENVGVVKSGRTHHAGRHPHFLFPGDQRLDNMLEKTRGMLELSLDGLKELALGGTAVGTGLNAPKGF